MSLRLVAAGLVASVTILSAGGVAAQPQSPPLAEVARRAEAAKATVKKARKSYTNSDLAVDPRREPAPPAAPAAGYVSATTGEVVTPEELVKRSEEVVVDKMGGRQPEEHWRARAESIRTQIDSLQVRKDALSKPNPAREANPAAKARNDAELARIQTGLDGLMKQWGLLEESLRVAAAPMAWIEPRPQSQE